MKTFFFTTREGDEGSIEANSIDEALMHLQTTFAKNVIKIEEMKERA